jgi:hypothetical protein
LLRLIDGGGFAAYRYHAGDRDFLMLLVRQDGRWKGVRFRDRANQAVPA